MLRSDVQKTIDAIYPIGALYLSMNNTNPETLFGGTWKQLTADAYLKIVTSGAGETAKGNTDHKISINQMPSHTHVQNAHYHNIWSCSNWSGNVLGAVHSNKVAGVGFVENRGTGEKYYKDQSAGNQIIENTIATNQNTGGASLLSWIYWCLCLVSYCINSLKEVQYVK